MPRGSRRGQGEDQQPVSRGFFWAIAIAAGGLMFFLLLIIAPLVVIQASSGGCGGEEEVAVPIQTNHQNDPKDLTETQIAIRVFLVGRVMNMTPRQIVTAYATAYVESTMTNIYGGDASSSGIYQQQDFSPWTDDERNRNNIVDTTISFFLQLRQYDHGQPVGDLAAEVQRPAEQYEDRYAPEIPKATNLYNRISRLLGTVKGVQSVQSLRGVTISGAGLDSLSLGSACSGLTATGPANLKRADVLYQPRTYKTLPANVWDSSFGPPQQVDSRIWQDVVWVLTTYHLKAANARETGHATHGDGTAVDIIPAEGNSQQVWDSTARKLALDLGWTPECAPNGYSKVGGGLCNLVPAIILVAYNNFEDGNHGDPAHGPPFPHIHVSWYSSCYGCGGGALVEPRDWVKAFPVGASTPTSALPFPSLFPAKGKKGKKNNIEGEI